MKKGKKHKKSYQDYMDELLAEDFYGTQTEEEEWDEVIERWNYSYNYFDDYDYYNYHYPWGDKWEDFTPCDRQCEFQQGGCCLIDDYGDKIFNHILNENCCSVGKYQMDYDKAKHIMALYEKYKNNPEQVEFILRLQGE